MLKGQESSSSDSLDEIELNKSIHKKNTKSSSQVFVGESQPLDIPHKINNIKKSIEI